jgi:FixJ family two-component response regulator
VTQSLIISIVDDDESVREGLSDLFRAMGFLPVLFSRAADFLNSDQIDHTRCLVADVQMPEMSGIELHRRLSQSGRIIPTILITAYPDERDRLNALQAGVHCYLVKPYDHEELLACIGSAIGPQAKRRQP